MWGKVYNLAFYIYIVKVDYMNRRQVNLKLEDRLIREVERLIERGKFESKTAAFTRALQLLIKSYRVEEFKKRIDEIRGGTEGLPSATEAVIISHEEEDRI
ncbi:MAG: hypothetical protein QXO32_08400 [Candidatus Bathyarchaeia archaeon]